MADSAKHGVDGISLGAFEGISLQKSVLLEMSDHRLDGISSSQFALDCGRGDATRVGYMDIQSVAVEPMAAIATVEIGAGGLGSGDAGDLVELGAKGMTIIGIAGQRHGTEHELAALAALIGGRKGRGGSGNLHS